MCDSCKEPCEDLVGYCIWCAKEYTIMVEEQMYCNEYCVIAHSAIMGKV